MSLAALKVQGPARTDPEPHRARFADRGRPARRFHFPCQTTPHDAGIGPASIACMANASSKTLPPSLRNSNTWRLISAAGR